MMTKLLVAAALGWPLLLLFGGACGWWRRHLLRMLWLAPLPALALVLFGGMDEQVSLGALTFQLDVPGSMLLIASAALWVIGGFAAPSYFSERPPGGSFVVCWLLTLTGSLGVFLAVDLIGFLIFYALVSLPAYGLVVYDGTPEARKAGKLYLGFALLGENLLLPAFVLLFNGASPASPVVLLLLIAGFGAKIALLPLHFWMPPSYTAAPVPAAAVLSGAAVKAGIIGLLRFLPMEANLPAWGEALVIVGFCGAFYGVIAGLTQRNPKTVLAYSSVSQMGFLAAVIGMGMAAHDGGAVPLAAFYASHHVLAKGALFLALGACAARPILSMAPAALIGLGLAGLPLTGGALAKLAVKAPFGHGPAATLAALSAVGTAMLMTHFLFRMAETRKGQAAPSVGLVLPWLTGAVMCLAFPWLVFTSAGLTLPEIIAPAAIWKTLWPVAVGVAAAVALRRIHRTGIAPWDILSLAGRVLPAVRSLAAGIAWFESLLCRWAVACSLVVLLALIFVLLLALGEGSGF